MDKSGAALVLIGPGSIEQARAATVYGLFNACSLFQFWWLMYISMKISLGKLISPYKLHESMN